MRLLMDANALAPQVGIGGWIALVLLAAVIILSPLLLAAQYTHSRRSTGEGSHSQPGSLYQVPYATWFMIHLYVPAMGMLAVVTLGVTHIIDGQVIAALLSGLFGYVLGNVGSRSSQGAEVGRQPTRPAEGTDAAPG